MTDSMKNILCFVVDFNMVSIVDQIGICSFRKNCPWILSRFLEEFFIRLRLRFERKPLLKTAIDQFVIDTLSFWF